MSREAFIDVVTSIFGSKAGEIFGESVEKAATEFQQGKGTVRPAGSRPVKSPPTHKEIAKRAFEIWCEKGGNPNDNWAQAERELNGNK